MFKIKILMKTKKILIRLRNNFNKKSRNITHLKILKKKITLGFSLSKAT